MSAESVCQNMFAYVKCASSKESSLIPDITLNVLFVRHWIGYWEKATQ